MKTTKPTTKPTTCSLSFARNRGGDASTPPYSLVIEDDTSGVTVCEVHLTAEQFAAALTGSHQTNVPIEWIGVRHIGHVREVKTELVTVPDGSHKTAKTRARKAVAEFEVNGWHGRDGDAGNFHRHKGGGVYEVVFTRFVDPSTDPDADSVRLSGLEPRMAAAWLAEHGWTPEPWQEEGRVRWTQPGGGNMTTPPRPDSKSLYDDLARVVRCATSGTGLSAREVLAEMVGRKADA